MTPDISHLSAALEATWPAAELVEQGGWRLRRGADGGKRVSAATRAPGAPDAGAADVEAAAAAMRAWGQPALFRINEGEDGLDRTLADIGYLKADETTVFAAEAGALIDARPETARIIRGGTRIALMEEIWAAGGVGPGRLAVMARAPEPKAYMIARLGDRPAAVAFAATSGEIAAVHALETLAAARRQGAARMLMSGAARFAEENGARWLALAVTERNIAASTLYRALGMAPATKYHYRVRPD
ncbi:GNAT family N-acetyltransferase [Pikeienuella sp. HZG-20]|uniref:GNAT family N-acetyltransferase n=1 Tax=Paludibacillus litoralis TaxID=3133267 RepID=UPI0030EB12EF